MNLLLFSWGGAIVDILALLLIIGITIYSARQGFVKSFLSTFGWILSLLFAVLLCGVVARFLDSKFGTIRSVTTWLEGISVKIFGNELMDTTLAEANENSLNGNFASWIIRLVLSAKQSSDISSSVTINQVICPTIAYYIVCVLSLIGLFILFKILFFIIADLSKLRKRTIVGKINHIFGGLFGLIKGIVVLDFIIIIVNAIPLSFVQSIATHISSSILTNAFSKVNFISLIFDSLTKTGIINYLSSVL